MFTKESAERLANEMIEKWNQKDLDTFLSYFTDDVQLISTNIQRFIHESNGIIVGKQTLRNYWEYTIEKFPYYEYQLKETSFEENRLMLKFYNSIINSQSIEILSFNPNWKVYKMVESYV